MCPALVPHWTRGRTATEASQSLKRTSSVTYVQAHQLAAGVFRVKVLLFDGVLLHDSIQMPAVRDALQFVLPDVLEHEA
jgi:hypothetical protein